MPVKIFLGDPNIAIDPAFSIQTAVPSVSKGDVAEILPSPVRRNESHSVHGGLACITGAIFGQGAEGEEEA